MRGIALHRLEQAVSHSRREVLRVLWRERGADFEVEAEVGAEAAARFLQARNPARLVGAHQPRADIDRGDGDHLAVSTHGDLRGTAADIDVHHRVTVAGSNGRPRPSP